ncbi:ribose ABC transporter permease [Paenibacillus sp. LMG 31460]|uniref:Ribose ABC transporter permease n=1 Tax=Paenibacillus germinis TaxID=2654979 RepID=A0ABX1ZBV0_9BACL|nr:ribose ABC transporter permease [Paenibacillus germinis]NOU90820.1 ribose ABC transporter permease [Paenibacillus germinis]
MNQVLSEIERKKNDSWRKWPVVHYVVSNSGILIALVSLIVFFALTTSTFLSTSNVLNVLRQISINAIIAFGMTFTILINGIDLSVGSILAVSQVITIGLLFMGVPIVPALIVGLLIGAVLGLINGFVITKGKIPPFIVTLSMMIMARGFAYVLTGGRPMSFNNEILSFIGNGYIGPIPVPIIIMVICLIITSFILNKTKFGRHVYAVGGNREAARFSGIQISKIEMIVYTISGLLAGLSGVILAARMSSAQPTSGSGFELDAIAAVVLGGTSFSGGIGKIGGVFIGALIIGVLNNGLNLMHVSSYWQMIIKGLVIVTAVYVDSLKKKKRA